MLSVILLYWLMHFHSLKWPWFLKGIWRYQRGRQKSLRPCPTKWNDRQTHNTTLKTKDAKAGVTRTLQKNECRCYNVLLHMYMHSQTSISHQISFGHVVQFNYMYINAVKLNPVFNELTHLKRLSEILHVKIKLSTLLANQNINLNIKLAYDWSYFFLFYLPN